MNATERQRYPNHPESLQRRAMRCSGCVVVAGVFALAGLEPASAQERPMLVEYLPEAAQSDLRTRSPQTEAHALDEILGDSGVLALRIGYAAPESVVQAHALSIVLPGSDETLTFDDLVVEALDDLVVEALDSGYALYSRDRQSTTSTTLVVMGEDVMGTIHHDGAMYVVQPLGDGLTAVYLYDAAQLRKPPELKPDFVIPDADPEESNLPPRHAPAAAQDSRDQIDVLVVYSNGVRRGAGNVDAFIAQFVLRTNLAYRNSGITTRVRVVHSYETPYTPLAESNYYNMGTDLDRLRIRGDGYLDEMFAKREQYGADVVILLSAGSIDGACGGGLAYLLDHSPGLEWPAEWAFGVVSTVGRATCIGYEARTFAHEIGHIQGAHHNPEASSNPFYPYGHGLCNAGKNWRTVMSYNTGEVCEAEIEHFSNPVVLYRGRATGDHQLRNVVRVINETAIHVANFRQSKTPTTAASHALPLVPPASNTAQRGFVRIVNRSASVGTVRIHAIDDTGRRFGPVSLRLGPRQTRHFTSSHLERGGAGLSGLGDGTGNWRLELDTSLDIEPLAYIRSAGGVVTSVHAVAEETEQGARRIYHVPFFFPGSNQHQVSSLRLVNPGDANASIVITGVDDRGRAAPQGEVRLTLRAGAARMVTAQQLESGSGLSGRLGDGTGYWQLSISANRPIQVMSLLRSTHGHLINLSRGRAESSGGPPSPTGPDLVVQASVSNSSPYSEQSFTLRATVRNRGNARSAATRLRYFASWDATISAYVSHVGTDAVSGLAASGTSPESISLRASNPGSTRYYAACVVSVSGESNAGNNCSSAVRVTVRSDPPDLVVQSPSVSNSSPNPGQSFTLRATVHNQGNARSAATRLRYFRSSNATITTTDTQVGTDAVSGLAASGTSPESIRLRAPSSAGTYYYGACVVSGSGEGNSGNNCSSGVRVTVSGPGGSNYVGAIATGWVGQTCGFGWGLAINYRDEAAAIARAESECRSLGLRACERTVIFSECGALAYGESSTACSVFGGYGSSRSAAEQGALSFCGASFSGCTVRNASYCNAGAGSASAAEMQSDRQMADSPLDSRGSGPTPRHRSAHPVDGLTDRIEP